MNRAKTFAYICFGLMCLAVGYMVVTSSHTRTAQADPDDQRYQLVAGTYTQTTFSYDASGNSQSAEKQDIETVFRMDTSSGKVQSFHRSYHWYGKDDERTHFESWWSDADHRPTAQK